MPTNRKKRTRTRADLDAYQADQLIHGVPLIAGVGFAADIPHGCGTWSTADWKAFDAAAREAWQRIGPAFLAWWRRENETFTTLFANDPRNASKPWALEQFGEPDNG